MSIPFIVHQIWIQGGRQTMPAHVQILSEWVEKNVVQRGGVYKLWSEIDVLPLLPVTLLPIYHSCPNLAAKSDILRLLILYQYGGVYLDADMVLIQPDQLSWLISGRNIELVLPYLWEHDDDWFFGVNTVSVVSCNNCVLAAPPQSPMVFRILEAVAASKPYDASRDNFFDWTINSTGPLLIKRVIGESDASLVRYLPRSLVQQAEPVVPEQVSIQHIQQLRVRYPTAVLLHGQDRSWFSKSARSFSDFFLTLCAFCRKRSTLLALCVLILAILLVIVCAYKFRT